jgi:CubicO group peptidase (beta-lactamase class C family)
MMADLFPSHSIARGAAVSVLPRDLRSLDITYGFRGTSRSLNDFLERTRTTGFLVIKNGTIVAERYFGGAHEKSLFTSWSIAKSFTSTLVGLAIADGRIASVDRPVTDYIPELVHSGYRGVSIKDLLEMSSGIDFTEDAFAGHPSDVLYMWNHIMVNEAERLNDYAASLTRAEPPGTRFQYRSVDAQVLGWLVKNVTGKSLSQDLSERIWQPLGMESDAAWLTDRAGPDGMEAAYCCINATLRDYGRFGQMMLNRGTWNGKQIVPSRWIDEATTPQDSQVQFGKLIPGYRFGYGYQWWLPQDPPRTFVGEGVYFQFLYVNPSENLVIVKTSALDNYWDASLEYETWAAYAAIAQALHTN